MKKQNEEKIKDRCAAQSEVMRIFRENSYRCNMNSFTISLQTTCECNFRCTYCYEKKKKGSLDVSAVKNLIDKLLDAEKYSEYWNNYFSLKAIGNALNNLILDFFGGECLLEIDKIIEITNYIKEKCLKEPERLGIVYDHLTILLQTNGYLLRTKKVRDFIREWEPHISISASLDGSKEYHDMCRVLKGSGKGTFDVVKRNIEETLEEFPNLKDFVSRSTISSDSLQYLYDAYKELKGMNFQSIIMPIGLGLEWKENDHILFKEQLLKIMDDLLSSDHIPNYNLFFTNYGVGISAEELYNNKLKNTVTCMSNAVGTCFLDGRGISVAADGRLYTCIQFSDLTIPEEYKHPDLSIGTAQSGITDEGMEIVKKLRASYDRYCLEHEKCEGCISRAMCEHCPAMSYKESGDPSHKSVPECKLKKVLASVSALYRIKIEELKWKRFKSFL